MKHSDAFREKLSSSMAIFITIIIIIIAELSDPVLHIVWQPPPFFFLAQEHRHNTEITLALMTPSLLCCKVP